MGWLNFMRGGRGKRAGFSLYGQVVAAAREKALYADLGVPDTLDGRFDLVGLYAALLIRRLRALPEPGPGLAQAVFDAMFSDMDVILREMGVGDLSVGRKVRAMWEAFHGRAAAYETALEAGDTAALAAALTRNVWRGAAPEGAAVRLAGVALAQDALLATQGLDTLAVGTVRFVSVAEMAA